MQNRIILSIPRYIVIPALALLVTWAPVESFAGAYALNPAAKNRVEFHSKATLESFNGKAKKIEAEFDIRRKDLTKSTGTVTVDLRTLDTGIEMRNKHMRENHLHTDSFPNAVFRIDSLTGTDGLVPSVPTNMTVHGTMTIHGVSRPVTVPALLLLSADNLGRTVRLQTEFSINITDYRIPRPEFLFLKLAEEVDILVDLSVTPQAE